MKRKAIHRNCRARFIAVYFVGKDAFSQAIEQVGAITVPSIPLKNIPYVNAVGETE
jgi:hypothetical protein